MFRSTITIVIAVLLVSTAGCSQGDSNDAIEEQLAAVTAERDALLDAASRSGRNAMTGRWPPSTR